MANLFIKYQIRLHELNFIRKKLLYQLKNALAVS